MPAFTEFVAGQTLTADLLNDAFNALPQGFIGGQLDETADTTSGTTELIVAYINFTAEAGRRYKLEYGAIGQGTVAGDAFRFRMRYEATSGALTAAGPAFLTRDQNSHTDARSLFWTNSTTVLTAQDYAIGVTMLRTAGTGTYTFNGSVNSQKRLELYDMGAS